MRDEVIEVIPACPPIGGFNSPRYREAVAANQDLSVRGQQVTKVVIPPPPVAIKVEPPPPAQRRNFGQAPFANTNTTRRKD